MTRKRRRLYTLLLALVGLGTATALTLTAFRDNIVFFYSPSDLVAQPPGSRVVRIGGLVETGSVARAADSPEVSFRVTDNARSLDVHYHGILPDLFREGQGIVAQGQLRPDGVFEAREVLAKHDEKYMPPEVADALKRSGTWQESGNDGQQHATDTLKR
jgi:cytochrome c-type biogenesis protein CcmE